MRMLFTSSVSIEIISSWASTPAARKSTIEHLSKLRLLLKTSNPYVKEGEGKGMREKEQMKVLMLFSAERLPHYISTRSFRNK